MINPTNYNAADEIKKTHELELAIIELDEKLQSMISEWESMKKRNAEKISIAYTENIMRCLGINEVNGGTTNYFLRTAGFLSHCVAWYNGMDENREIKNNIASTLSLLFKNKKIGRYKSDDENNKKFYYGLKDYFNEDLQTLKDEYKDCTSLLAA